MSQFKDRLKEAREARSWTQADLAKNTGLTPSAISQFESGERDPNLESLKKLSISLNVSLDFLAGQEINKEVQQELPDGVAVFRNLKALNEKDKAMLIEIYNRFKSQGDSNA